MNTAQLRAFNRVAGSILWAARERRGWTRTRLAHALTGGVKARALGDYERGHHPMSLPHFVEHARVLGLSPSEVLRDIENTTSDTANDGIRINLFTVARHAPARLAPLRQWAIVRLRQRTLHELPEVILDDIALTPLAELCGVTVAEVIAVIRRIAENARTRGLS